MEWGGVGRVMGRPAGSWGRGRTHTDEVGGMSDSDTGVDSDGMGGAPLLLFLGQNGLNRAMAHFRGKERATAGELAGMPTAPEGATT